MRDFHRPFKMRFLRFRLQTFQQTWSHTNSFLPFSLAGLGQPEGQARPDSPESPQARGGAEGIEAATGVAEAVVEPSEVAPDLCAERRLDSVLEVGQARRGIR